VAIGMARTGDLPGAEQARRVLAGFRGRLYRCLTGRGDELSGLGDAVLCADGPVHDSIAADLRLPWQRPQPPGTMTPARVRRGFRCVRETAGTPAAPPKPGKPGPGRPAGSTNRCKAPRYDLGKRHPKTKKRTKHRATTKRTG